VSSAVGWELTEEEQRAVMTAVEEVVAPWLGPTTIVIDGKACIARLRRVRDDAPGEIKRLEAVFMDVCEKGLVRSPIGLD
jgi:hypothetical protein